jgi:hypothetical protein
LVAFQDCQLYTLVGPQAVEGVQELLRHGLFGANIWRRVDHLGVALKVPKSVHCEVQRGVCVFTYDAFLVLEVCVVLLHGGIDGLEGRDQVVEDGRAPCLAFVLSKTTSVDDAHLLQHRGLSTFTGTCIASQSTVFARSAVVYTEQQELHLALCLLLVHAEVLLDVLIFPGLGVHGFPSKTHYRWCHVMLAK